MSKLSVINRNEKRKKLVARYAKKRAALEAVIANAKTGDEERYMARQKLQALPRNAHPTRVRNRCSLTGRPRGVYAKFGLGRNALRKATMNGDVPGLRKASW